MFSLFLLLLLYMCAQVVLLDESNIALFGFKITFCHIGGDTFESVKEEHFWSLFTDVCFNMCVLRLCLWRHSQEML